MARKAEDDILIKIRGWEIRKRKPRRKRQPEVPQRWTIRTVAILGLALVLMAVAVVGLVLLLAFLSRPQAGQILVALLRFMLVLLMGAH
jgi:hypothetical protein